MCASVAHATTQWSGARAMKRPGPCYRDTFRGEELAVLIGDRHTAILDAIGELRPGAVESGEPRAAPGSEL
eukprot:7808048-Alexandrium_andersonii.AAC.1